MFFTLNPGNGTAVSSNRFAWDARILVSNLASESSQFNYMQTNAPNMQSDLSYGGASSFSPKREWHGFSDTSIDTSADQTLQITAQWSSQSTSLSWRKKVAVLRFARN